MFPHNVRRTDIVSAVGTMFHHTQQCVNTTNLHNVQIKPHTFYLTSGTSSHPEPDPPPQALLYSQPCLPTTTLAVSNRSSSISTVTPSNPEPNLNSIVQPLVACSSTRLDHLSPYAFAIATWHHHLRPITTPITERSSLASTARVTISTLSQTTTICRLRLVHRLSVT